jgi:hypothetical protein
MTLSDRTDNNLIDQTLEVWRPHSRKELSRDDARQIIHNATGFFSVLAEWARAESDEATDQHQDLGEAQEVGHDC